MEKDYKKLFSILDEAKAPSELKTKIIFSINQKERVYSFWRRTGLKMISLISFITLIPTLQHTISDFINSGFYEYLSIATYDSGLTLSFWREIGLSLMESIPLYSVTLLMATLFVSLFSFMISIKNTRNISNYQFN